MEIYRLTDFSRDTVFTIRGGSELAGGGKKFDCSSSLPQR